MIKEYLPYIIGAVLIFLLHSYYYLRTRFLNAELLSEIEQKNRLLEKLQHLAVKDELTGLPNRKLTLQLLRRELMQSARTGSQVALLFVDLVNFKQINQQYGHVQGDIILSQLGNLLDAQIRGNDLVGRMGGDEFLIVLSDIANADDADVVANKLIHQVGNMDFEAINQSVSINIGVLVLIADEASSVENTLSEANVVLDQARQDGPGSYYLQDMTRELA